MTFEEKTIALNKGVDTYNPDIVSQEVRFSRLKNIHPRIGRYVLPNGLELVQEIGDEPVIAFPYYTEPISKYSALYAVTPTSIYVFDFAAGEFDETPIYSSFPGTNSPVMVVPWYDAVFVSQAGGRLVKLQADTATEVEDAPGGRYGLSSNSHLMIGYTSREAGENPTEIAWSDLYLPESFTIATDSEADIFQLEVSDEEQTGLSYQRGANLIYTKNSIWIARYYPLPTGYKFEPLFTGIGNVYHGAQIRVKEVDLFIGEDNIYMLDGFQLNGIGDPIWAFFDGTIDKSVTDLVIRTTYDYEKAEVTWIYPHIDGGVWSIVYNYKEDKWSDRDPLGVSCLLKLRAPLRGFLVIDDIGDMIDDVDEMIDGDWQYLSSGIQALVGAGVGKVFQFTENFGRFAESVSDTIYAAEFETFEIFNGKLGEVTEINKATISFSGGGDPDVQLMVGTRRHRFEAITWSAAKLLSDSLPGETAFFFRNDGVGRLIRFKLLINNTDEDYVSELTHMSFDHLENVNDDPQ